LAAPTSAGPLLPVTDQRESPRCLRPEGLEKRAIATLPRARVLPSEKVAVISPSFVDGHVIQLAGAKAVLIEGSDSEGTGRLV
jgi:hypothetical protein